MINECILTGDYDGPVFVDSEDETRTMGQRELLSEFIKNILWKKFFILWAG